MYMYRTIVYQHYVQHMGCISPPTHPLSYGAGASLVDYLQGLRLFIREECPLRVVDIQHTLKLWS